MEDESLKRNTDCVYFLASPLTCKKGLECEFRHNEMARLNPRDCWYWLSGNCLNPACAFRHPPLDAHSETGSESSSAKQPSALPANNKTNVPCYYFYNGYCNKGDACFFMHGPDGNASSLKSIKQVPAAADAQVSEKKLSKGSDSMPAAAEMSSFTDDSKSAVRRTVMPEQKSGQPNLDNLTKQNACRQISGSLSDDANTIRSNSSIHTVGLIKTSVESPYQSSDDQVADHDKQEDCQESSFDVLVNDGSEEIEYEDEELDSPRHDFREREINGKRLRYEHDDMIEYDPAHREIRASFEREYIGYRDRETHNLSRRTSAAARERVFDRPLGGEDLRDHLLKRRMARAPLSPYQTGQFTERVSLGAQLVHGRLASKVEVSAESRMIRETHWSDNQHQHHRERHAIPVIKRSRKETKARRPGKRQLPSEVSERNVPRKRRIIEDPALFTGPKTLAQLIEEKRRALGDIAAPSSSES